VVVLPLARGGVDWPAETGAALLACLAAMLAAGVGPVSIPAVVLALGAVLVATALQLLPVPAALHRAVSPGAASVFETALAPLALYPAARPFSLDPPVTGRALAVGAASLLSALAAARLADSRRRRDRLLATVALSGLAVSAVGLLAALAGRAPLLEPRLTFVNPNHLAGFLNLTSFVSLGFALRSRGRTRLLWLIAFAVAASGVFLSLSRGGIAAFFVGAAVFGVLSLRRLGQEAGPRRPWRLAAVPAALAVALAVAAWLAFDPVLAEMRTVKGATSEAKARLWPAAASMLWEFPLTGVGRGAFATAFASRKAEPEAYTFTHAENEWIQPLVDLGIPVGLLLVGAVLWTWLRGARWRQLSRPELGALAGMAALGAHNAVDFSLELAGVAVPFAVLLGVVARDQPSLSLRPAVARAGAAAVLALALGGMALHRRHPGDAEVLAIARAASADAAVGPARSAARWHPADYLPHALVGVRLVQEGHCAEAMPWLGRAMILNPTAAEPHRYAARCFAAGGKDELAKREYRLAVLFGDPRALSEAVRRYAGVDDLLAIAPDTPAGLLALAGHLAADRPADAAKALRRAWEEYRDLDALRGLLPVSLALGDAEGALELARRYQALRPSDAAGYAIAARALSKLDRPEEAHGELELGVARVPGSPELLGTLAEQALAARRFAEARRLVESMTARTPGELASKRLAVARILWTQGRHGEAIQEARSASAVVPDDPGPRVALATYCAGAGRLDEAIAALEGAAALPGARPGAYAAELARLRSARQAQLEERERQQMLRGPEGSPGEPRP
jgi:Flp pilus assembly protein TadD